MNNNKQYTSSCICLVITVYLELVVVKNLPNNSKLPIFYLSLQPYLEEKHFGEFYSFLPFQ